jgi:hypothetical protein
VTDCRRDVHVKPCYARQVRLRSVSYLMVAVACSSYGGTSTPQSADAGGGDAGTVDSGRPPPAAIFYVAGDNGNDTADGKSPQTAMKTIGNALGQNIVGAEVRVCRGSYQERNLIIRRNTVVRGGYNCTTWQRGTGFGKAGGFQDSNNDTTLEASAANAMPAAVRVEGAEVTDALLEGFTVVGGAPSALQEGSAIRVAGKATLAVEDCVVRGGAGMRSGSDGAATVGILASDAKLFVRRSNITGGAGVATTTSIGSTGILMSGAEGVVEDSEIASGTGTSAQGAGGRALDIYTLSGPLRLEKNIIVLSQASHAVSTSVGGTSGILVTSATSHKLEILNNRVQGTSQRCAGASGTSCVIYGIYVDSVVGARIAGNWVAPGTVTDASNGASYGIIAQRLDAVQILNNVVLTERPVAPIGNSIAVMAYDAGGLVAHNTVIVLSNPTVTGSTIALYAQSPRDLRMENNALTMVGYGSTVANYGCDSENPKLRPKPLTQFSHNAVFGSPYRVTSWAGTAVTCMQTTSASIAMLPPEFGTNTTGNIDLATIAHVPSDATALDAVRQGTLRLTTDPKLACTLAKKGSDLRAVVDKDIFGTVRSATPTIGAIESNVGTCP